MKIIDNQIDLKFDPTFINNSKLCMPIKPRIILKTGLFFLTLATLNAQSEHIISLPADSIKKMTGKDTAEILAVIQNDSIVKIIVPFDEKPTAVDVDSNYYSVIKIGTLYWMAENLRTTRFNDGTNIPLIENDFKWSGSSTPAYCWLYNNEGEYKHNYVALYNWYAVETEKLCPLGWHVPSDEEWKQLEISIGMSNSLVDSVGYRGTNEASKLKKHPDIWWDMDVEDATNESGFSALPAGLRSGDNGRFYGFGNKGAEWWTSTEYKYWAWMRGFVSSGNNIRRYPENKKDGRSVRCVKD